MASIADFTEDVLVALISSISDSLAVLSNDVLVQRETETYRRQQSYTPRDSHRCVISMVWDYESVLELPSPDTKKPRGRTALVNIISLSRKHVETGLAEKWVTIRSLFPGIDTHFLGKLDILISTGNQRQVSDRNLWRI